MIYKEFTVRDLFTKKTMKGYPKSKENLTPSSLNRSNSKAFHHIMPYSAPVCEGMHYHKTEVPWHTKSTFIIALFLPVLQRFPGVL